MSATDPSKNAETTGQSSVAEDASHALREQSQEPTKPPSRILWYRNEIGPRLSPETRTLFETYSSISGEKLIEHLHSIRDEAWPLGQYPCVGLWGFLHSSFRRSPAYDEILARLRQGATLLDLGCGLGQDLRRLAADGAPTENVWAADLNPGLWKLGYSLFRDDERMKARFVHVDLRAGDNPLAHLARSIDVVLLYQVLHLFGWEDQIAIVKKVLEMARGRTVVVGSQMGRLNAVEKEGKWGRMFYHTPETFKELWKQAAKDTSTEWEVECTLMDLGEWGLQTEDYSWMDSEFRALDFVVREIVS